MMEDELYLEVSGSPSDDGSVEVPPETLVMLCLLQQCGREVRVVWVSGSRPACARVRLPRGATAAAAEALVPAWCQLPGLRAAGGLSAGLCACARRLLAPTPSPPPPPPVHPHGFLGFRTSCLQAPNETSVWTKFCEIQVPATTTVMLNTLRHNNNTSNTVMQIPDDIIKFEYHLKKPIRVHNVHKLARDVAKLSVVNNSPPFVSIDKEIKSERDDNRTQRTNAKQRKWKSNKTDISDTISPIESLSHDFAEGPHLTLADIILYSCLYLILNHFNRENLENTVPRVLKWFDKLRNLAVFTTINRFLEQTDELTFNSAAKFNVEVDTSNVENSSLYKHDPRRNVKKKKMFTKECDIETALDLLTDSLELNWSVKGDGESDHKIDWTKIPADASPYGGHLPDDRMQRKTEQLENLATAVMNIAKDGNVIVDFCSGGGHLGILLGYLLPKCTVILLENKEQSLKMAQARVEDLKLTNIYFIQCNLDFFIAPFDIGVALHACGVSTDLVLENCIDRNAAFVICPCCYGSLHETDRLKYPRSREFSVLSVEQYVRLGHAADQTHVDHPLEQRGARCMSVIDSDRARHAMDRGYSVTLGRLIPLTCTPKNMLLVGIPG